MGTTVQEKINQEKERLIKYLNQNGLKLTTGRKIVFDEVMHAHGHFAAEELVKQCKRNKRSVSRATIYRALQDLLKAGVIRETAYGEKHQHFEHIYDEQPHHHAKCLNCGIFIEFPDLGEDKIYRPFLNKKGFKVIGHEMHFYGICKDCQK
jgi:Fur family ferric uptake transcriptional regulator